MAGGHVSRSRGSAPDGGGKVRPSRRRFVKLTGSSG